MLELIWRIMLKGWILFLKNQFQFKLCNKWKLSNLRKIINRQIFVINVCIFLLKDPSAVPKTPLATFSLFISHFMNFPLLLWICTTNYQNFMFVNPGLNSNLALPQNSASLVQISSRLSNVNNILASEHNFNQNSSNFCFQIFSLNH